MKRTLAALGLTLVTALAIAAHTPLPADMLPSDPKATPAYGVLLLRKAAVEAEITGLSRDFTSRHPDVGRRRFELNAIRLEMEKMRATQKRRLPKLSDTYGNLILRKVTLEVGLNDLRRNFTPRHPEVMEKRAELLALERELENLLS